MAKKSRYIAIEDIALDLGVLDSDVYGWVKAEKVSTSTDHRGRASIEKSFVSDFSNSSEYVECLKISISSDSTGWQESRIFSERLKSHRLSLLEKYKLYLSELKEIHQSILPSVNFHDFESPVKAAYLLFSKAISCLIMGCENMERGYWFSGSVIREVDETLDLASYFIVLSGTEDGARDITKWFRQNYAPKHSDCRTALSDHAASLLMGVDAESQRSLMFELYQKKSKWVHPTFGVIREVTEFEVFNDSLDIAECSLGSTKNQAKLLGLTEFYKSSIWSAFQTFNICFSKSLPLTGEIVDRLMEIDREFQTWS